jgi:hypothetical protein
MASNEPLNRRLYRLHLVFFIAYAAFSLIFVLMTLGGEELRHSLLIPLGFSPILLLHLFAARGAKYGKTYGRVLSGIIATIWLVGVPIGTILGIYTWMQLGDRWVKAQ